MTKAETTALLDAVKNAPIIKDTIVVTVCGTTFTFGCVREGDREKLLSSIRKACSKKIVKNIPQKEYDNESNKSQKALLWWKDNLDKTIIVLYAHYLYVKLREKWKDVKWYNMTKKQKQEYDDDCRPIDEICKSIGMDRNAMCRKAIVRNMVPKAWLSISNTEL